MLTTPPIRLYAVIRYNTVKNGRNTVSSSSTCNRDSLAALVAISVIVLLLDGRDLSNVYARMTPLGDKGGDHSIRTVVEV